MLIFQFCNAKSMVISGFDPSTCLQQAGFFPDLTSSSLSLSMGTSLLFLSFLCLYNIQGQRGECFLIFVAIYSADVSLKPKLPLYQTLLIYWMTSVRQSGTHKARRARGPTPGLALRSQQRGVPQLMLSAHLSTSWCPHTLSDKKCRRTG